MKTLAYMLLVLLVSVVFSSVDVGSYSILERTLPAVLGACLGGVLACASIIISVLSGSSKKTKAKAKDSHHFMSFISSLEHDVKILVACLFFTVMLPYLRSLNYPMTLSLFDINPSYLKDKIFSTLEIFTALIAFLVIFELVGVLIIILKKMMTIHDSEI